MTAVFSDDLLTAEFAITSADWEIRAGVSEGNAGNLVASGTTNSPVVTPTGRGGFGLLEFMIEVTGLNVFLPTLPAGQRYWLNVTPVGNNGRSFNSTTSGTNCVGTPCGNDQMAFFNSTYFGYYFTSTGNPNLGQPYDYSNGVIGNVVPEPGTMALLIWGVGGLLIALRRRRAICWTVSAFVIWFSSIPQSRGQTLGTEQQMGEGYEPVVNCDRRVNSNDLNKRIQFVWMQSSQTTIHWAISHNLGGSWDTACLFYNPHNLANESRNDPINA